MKWQTMMIIDGHARTQLSLSIQYILELLFGATAVHQGFDMFSPCTQLCSRHLEANTFSYILLCFAWQEFCAGQLCDEVADAASFSK